MTRKVAVITGGSQGTAPAWWPGTGSEAGRWWPPRTIKPSPDPDVLTVAADITDPASAGRIIGAALERFARIDTLVNNVGVYLSKPFTDYTAAARPPSPDLRFDRRPPTACPVTDTTFAGEGTGR